MRLRLRVKAATKCFLMSCQRCPFVLHRTNWLSKWSSCVATVTSSGRQNSYLFGCGGDWKGAFLKMEGFFWIQFVCSVKAYFKSVEDFISASWHFLRFKYTWNIITSSTAGDSDLPHTNKALHSHVTLTVDYWIGDGSRSLNHKAMWRRWLIFAKALRT